MRTSVLGSMRQMGRLWSAWCSRSVERRDCILLMRSVLLGSVCCCSCGWLLQGGPEGGAVPGNGTATGRDSPGGKHWTYGSQGGTDTLQSIGCAQYCRPAHRHVQFCLSFRCDPWQHKRLTSQHSQIQRCQSVSAANASVQIEGVLSDFVRLREESSYLDGGTLLEGGGSYNDLMADDEDNYQLGESQIGCLTAWGNCAKPVRTSEGWAAHCLDCRC
jgi:hypothetical protein